MAFRQLKVDCLQSAQVLPIRWTHNAVGCQDREISTKAAENGWEVDFRRLVDLVCSLDES